MLVFVFPMSMARTIAAPPSVFRQNDAQPVQFLPKNEKNPFRYTFTKILTHFFPFRNKKSGAK
jgi:hypothetical protein